ncbi:XRE family transcriptional regulator [Sporofaciens musculi]|uniref:XRE family transcriptional regulator n=1 Tax=Sporofaciens musculi TaxID=2681861 RepID=UPI002F425AFF
MSIGSRIKDLREEKGLSRPELAKLLNVTVGSISNYENDVSSPKEPILFKIIETLGCDANYLFQDVVKITSRENDVTLSEYEHIKNFRSLDSMGKEHVLTVLGWELDRVSALNNSKETPENLYTLEFPTVDSEYSPRILNYYQRLASAGTGQIVFDDVPVDLIEIPDIPKYDKVKYAIGVNGDSMEPLYYDGDILLIEPMQDIRVDDIGLFIVDGEALVKKRGKKSLISLNKKKHYPEIPITEETRCLGRVVDKISTSNSSLDKQNELFKQFKALETQNAAYAELNAEDISALERGRDLLWAQALGIDKNSGVKESTDKSKTVSHPDISALDPKDLAALERGKIKMFKPEKNA